MAFQQNQLSNITERGKKILLITPRFPFPVIGGDKLRIYNIMKYLSRFYRLSLASLYSTEEEEKAMPEDGIFEEVWRVRQPKVLSYCHTAGSLLRGRSLQSGYFYNSHLKRLIKQKIDGYDLVLAHLVRVSDYVKGTNVPSICELTDAISMNYARAGSGKLTMKRLLYSFERKRCLDAERTCLEDFDGCVVVSPKDRDYLRLHCPEHTDKMHVIPNGVRVEDFPFRREIVRAGKIVFIGNMRTLQNADAAVYFAKEVFPGIRKKLQDATFWIIGADPDKTIRALSANPGVFVTGRVDDVREYAFDAAASVCPVRVGAGIQNKVLESMAMGIPVVTSSVGAEGLDAIDGTHFRVADGADGMGKAVLDILESRSAADCLSNNARRLVEERYSWEGMLRSYKSLIDTVLDGAGECRSL